MNLETVVFGKGYLGTRMVEELGFESAPKFDVLDRSTLNDYLNTNKPKVVINAIGRTGRPNIDWCETHKEETLRSNVAAVICLAENCVKRGIYFVHFGSGCIYQGDKEFTEKDRPNFFGPQHYAKTKILAEEELSMMEGDILQLRIRMPIDDRSHERNLIDKLRKYSKVIDIQNSMTTVPHMLEAIKTLIEKRSTGIYNMTNPGTQACTLHGWINGTFQAGGIQSLPNIQENTNINFSLYSVKLVLR